MALCLKNGGKLCKVYGLAVKVQVHSGWMDASSQQVARLVNNHFLSYLHSNTQIQLRLGHPGRN